MDSIRSFTCVKFTESTGNGNYISITTNYTDTCETDVGYLGKAGQKLNLDSYCMDTKGNVIHEIMHALGFYHEHQVPWRKDFLKIITANLKLDFGYRSAYWILDPNHVIDLGFGYDYDSVMHYGPYEHSINRKPTMEALKPGAENMGLRTGLSPKDIFKINKVYKCPQP